MKIMIVTWVSFHHQLINEFNMPSSLLRITYHFQAPNEDQKCMRIMSAKSSRLMRILHQTGVYIRDNYDEIL